MRQLSSMTLLGVLAVAVSTAGADTARPKKKARTARGPDVAAAVASGDPERLCRVAIELGRAGDHARAGLLVGACERVPGDDAALADAARTTRIAVSKAATAGDWSKVELVLAPAGATATVDAYPEIPLTSGAWRLPPGRYTVATTGAGGTASQQLVLKDGIRALVMLEPAPAPAAVGGRRTTLDFTSGEPMAPPVAGPPVVKHGSLLPARYRKGLAARPRP